MTHVEVPFLRQGHVLSPLSGMLTPGKGVQAGQQGTASFLALARGSHCTT